uniref:SH2 domain-containing protein n=2 Tax=Anopheles stephensi TaxID=30069 RepID=A0A182YQ15_ANOST
MLIVGGLAGKSHPESNPSKSPSHHAAAVQPSSPSSNFKLLSGKFAIDSKRKINCKTRIYKCIKRILKRNSFHTGASKDHAAVQQSPKGQRTHTAHRSPNAADYREIKSLLEKQHRDLEYDVNLAKCVEKPAFIKKIAINMLQSAVSDEKDDDSTLVLHREQTACVTGTIQSDLEREREYQRLLDECWYHENLPRSLSLQLLIDKPPGSFLVRKSTSQPDCYALSLRVPPGSGPRIAHYLIVRTATDGYKIKGFQKEFSSLRALIVHHSVMPEALPVPLAVPRPVNLVVKTKFEDDYETVFDLAKAVPQA